MLTRSQGKLIGYQLLPGALTPRDLSNPSYRTFTLAANVSSLVDYAQNTWLPEDQAWVRCAPVHTHTHTHHNER